MVGLVKWNGHVQDLAACVDLNLHANTILAAQVSALIFFTVAVFWCDQGLVYVIDYVVFIYLSSKPKLYIFLMFSMKYITKLS